MYQQRIKRRAAAMIGTAVTASLAFAPSAMAAPDNTHTLPVDLSCSDGSSYTLSTLDTNSPWAAFHDVTGTVTFVPVYYRDVDVRVYTADGGTLLFEDDSSHYTPRGALPERLGVIKDCSFVITSTQDDADLGDVIVRVAIDLGLRVTPAGGSR